MKEFENNALFWQKVDSLFLSSTKTLMKKKGDHHDTYNNLVYPVDYSRIVDMKSPSAHGVAVYMGSGNRNSVTGLIVAADILEKLGVNLMLETDRAEEVLEETDMAFLFAQKYHSAMKNVGPVRKEMGERTIFNILGPLTNPANASRQLLGVYDKELVEKLAEVLANLGVTRGMSVCGSDGLDEITVTGPTHCCEIKDGKLTSFEITPEQFGLSTYPLAELVGGTPEENAQITKDILSGTLKGAKRDVVLMNAGIGIYLGSENLTMEEGIKKAEELINSGKAYEKMEEFVKATQQ